MENEWKQAAKISKKECIVIAQNKKEAKKSPEGTAAPGRLSIRAHHALPYSEAQLSIPLLHRNSPNLIVCGSRLAVPSASEAFLRTNP